jgi:hypothetical protein
VAGQPVRRAAPPTDAPEPGVPGRAGTRRPGRAGGQDGGLDATGRRAARRKRDQAPSQAERDVVTVPGALDDELWTVDTPPGGPIDTPAERRPPRPAATLRRHAR